MTKVVLSTHWQVKFTDAKMRLNNTGKRLTLRASIGVSVLGRNQTWIRAD